MKLFRQTRTTMRPWIAMAAAFALALQMLLAGVLATQADAASLGSGSPFTICLGDGAVPADHGSDKAPAKHLPCVLCTLAKLSHAIVPTGGATAVEVRQFAAVVFPTIDHIAHRHFTTGHYQRGPPAHIAA